MSIRLLSRIKLTFLPYPFELFAHHQFNAGNCGLIVRVDQLQAQALDILIVGALTHHLVRKDLFTSP